MDNLFEMGYDSQSEVWWDEGWDRWATQCDCIAFDRYQNGKIYRHTGIDILKDGYWWHEYYCEATGQWALMK